ncbi:MAG: N-6 DNA methylase [Gammaproteobacteria bacterium]|nr:N-6 DNA methylase [Gammaproteobacteria bacterium]
MSVNMVTTQWLDTLRLGQRTPPEFIQPSDNLSAIPHGTLIRQSFDELGLAAIHCVSNVPTIAFLVQENFNQNEINQIHKALWNQGLVSLLVVITGDTLRAYSLAQLPSLDGDLADKLVHILNLVNDALELKNLVFGVESGRFIAEHEKKFKPDYRVDQVLLGNLEATVKSLVAKNMPLASAQALLMQVMFIAYLEDKGIINARYFQKATINPGINSLKSLLADGCPDEFLKLFKLLKKHFNGDLFVAPCSFDEKEPLETINTGHIEMIAEFRAGNIRLDSGQYQFWPYDFRFVPIGLISAVYGRFLGFDPVTKRTSGAYYTPMFLADLVTEQAWSTLSEKQKKQGHYFDPACGSGIFLVRFFAKMVDEWKVSHHQQRPTWPALLSMLNRLHGLDIKKEAIRVAAFSLYIALLENTRPSEILALMGKGRLLPKLCGKTLNAVDFFTVPHENKQYDLVIGNPPWVSRRGDQKSAEQWCKTYGYKMPAKEIAWGFTWKALAHIRQHGVVVLLLKATSLLTNHSQPFIATRSQWLNDAHLIRIINFADTRFQLFAGGDAPAALAIYKPKCADKPYYRFDYWTPKADLNLKTKRLMMLSTADQARLPIQLVKDDPLLLKRRMWMQTPDAKLFQYLSSLPRLEGRLITYQNSKKKINVKHEKWIIGQGFIPAQEHNLANPSYTPSYSSLVTQIPHLDIQAFEPLVLRQNLNAPWPTETVRRKGFERGFKAPSILIPQGIGASGRLRASYCVQNLSFRHSIQAISFDKEDEKTAKFLTVLLNSSLVAWFLFHNSSNTGMERAKVHQEQLLYIPFLMPDDTSHKHQSNRAFDQAIQLIDGLLQRKDNLLQAEITNQMQTVDQIIYQYFGLDQADILLIEDTLKYVIPSMQPRSSSKTIPTLWKDANEQDWSFYAKWLVQSLCHWLEKPYQAVVELVGTSPDLVVIGVQLSNDKNKKYFNNNQTNDMDAVLTKIWDALPQHMPGNFQLIPDLRVFIDDVLYLVKPRKKRFWLGSTALADADAIAADLLTQAG